MDHVYRAKGQHAATVKVYQAKVQRNAEGRPVRVPGELVHTFTVTGASIDGRRALALQKARQFIGHNRVSISCTPDGFAVTVPPEV